MLSTLAILDLQAAYRVVLDTDLSDADAQALGNRLLELFELLTETPDASSTEPQPR